MKKIQAWIENRDWLRCVIGIMTLVSLCLFFPGDSGAGTPKKTAVFSAAIGDPVALFQGTTIQGKDITSARFGDNVLILTFWGLNCRSCLSEMQALQKLYDEFKGQGLLIWAINTEDISAQEIVNGLSARNIQISYELIADPGLNISRFFTSWFIPVTVIVDSEGTVEYYKIGFNEADIGKIKAKVGALLAQ